MDLFTKDEDTVHREALWKTIAHHIEAVPVELRKALEERKFDRLIILGNLDEHAIGSLPLDVGPKIFLGYMVKRIRELTIPFLNADLNSRVGSHRSVDITPNQKTMKKRKHTPTTSAGSSMLGSMESEADFNASVYQNRIAVLVANFLNTKSVPGQVKPGDVQVIVSKNEAEPPVAKVVRVSCKLPCNVALTEARPGVFHPTLSNFFKHYTKSHPKYTPPVMNKDIRTAFTRTKKENVRNQEQQTTVTESSASH
ncbi:uncharacterized protein LOC129764263 [Toxorhynchites rutilus septentrionalis]|uniref:uncharacterized protein LOC129764263 n=1 Tax=Toxorhynchites rutilus septentrionalis TaxID=329112 RepID=UPI002478A768|nr:uncharacterized protein LOC129764263 [Toxorhynchites rutilus septentrionalis]